MNAPDLAVLTTMDLSELICTMHGTVISLLLQLFILLIGYVCSDFSVLSLCVMPCTVVMCYVVLNRELSCLKMFI